MTTKTPDPDIKTARIDLLGLLQYCRKVTIQVEASRPGISVDFEAISQPARLNKTGDEPVVLRGQYLLHEI